MLDRRIQYGGAARGCVRDAGSLILMRTQRFAYIALSMHLLRLTLPSPPCMNCSFSVTR